MVWTSTRCTGSGLPIDPVHGVDSLGEELDGAVLERVLVHLIFLSHEACLEGELGLTQPPRQRRTFSLAHGGMRVLEDVEGLVPAQPRNASKKPDPHRVLVVRRPRDLALKGEEA